MNEKSLSSKIWNTVGIVVLVVLSAIILSQGIEIIIFSIYIAFLVSIFFVKERSNKVISMFCAIAVPILEGLGLSIYWERLDGSFPGYIIDHSYFFGVMEWTGYVVLCIVIPVALLEISKIWEKRNN